MMTALIVPPLTPFCGTGEAAPVVAPPAVEVAAPPDDAVDAPPDDDVAAPPLLLAPVVAVESLLLPQAASSAEMAGTLKPTASARLSTSRRLMRP
jgi:hypothetical protein